MKKIKEFMLALGHVPKLFKTVYKTDKLYLFYMIGETICFAFVPYPTLYLSKYALDALENGSKFSDFTIVCVLLIFLQLIVLLLKSFFNSVRPQRNILVTGKLFNSFHKKCMELDYELLAEKEIGELKQFAGEFVKYKLSQSVWSFISIFSNVITFIYSGVLLLGVNQFLLVIIFLGLLVESLISSKVIPIRFELDRQISHNNRKIDYFNNVSTNEIYAKDLRIFGMGEKLYNKIFEITTKSLDLEKKKIKLSFFQSISNSTLSIGIDLVIYAVLGFLVLNDNITIGMLSFAIGNLALFRTNISKIAETLTSYSEIAMHLEHYTKFMSLESKFRQTGDKSVSIIPEDDFVIEFNNVSFKYPGQCDYVLEHLNLKVNSGEKISVVGENGAGKTTFIKLLMRLYDPTEGSILINGIDIKEFNYDEYLSLYAPVFQDHKLFAFTVNENISSFGNEINKDLVVEAAERSGISERISRLPDKYETYISKQFNENGVEFSGGEQQKISIARTYYKTNALITILDEPTSALDPRAESKIYTQFNDLVGSNTTFFISHRLASTKFCDKIVVIKDKKVHELGSFFELMRNKGYYYSLYKMQSSYYRKGDKI